MLHRLDIREDLLGIDPRVVRELENDAQVLVCHLWLEEGHDETVALCEVVVPTKVEEEVVVERVVAREKRVLLGPPLCVLGVGAERVIET